MLKLLECLVLKYCVYQLIYHLQEGASVVLKDLAMFRPSQPFEAALEAIMALHLLKAGSRDYWLVQ